jgi:2-dehydro-3-deoxyphosphogalactonate aldolase
MIKNKFELAFQRCPLVGILRGIRPSEAIDVTETLVSVGFKIIEVPLNSPEALKSIEKIVSKFGDSCVIGAGTVVSEKQVTDLHNAGAALVVSPHADPELVEKTLEYDMYPIPGIATPTEAFRMIKSGATTLKIFPSELIKPKQLSSLVQVLPKNIRILPVGGINHENISDYLKAGAHGFGLGASLYQPGLEISTVRKNAVTLIKALRLDQD